MAFEGYSSYFSLQMYNIDMEIFKEAFETCRVYSQNCMTDRLVKCIKVQ